MRLQVALCQIGHGERGLRRCRHGVLAPFDAVDDGNRLFARLLDGELAMPAEGNALRSSRAAALDDIDLAPGRIDANSEAGQFAIPEDGVVCFDGQPVDGSFGDCELGSFWHRIGSPSPFETVRSRCDDNEEDDGNSTLCQAAPVFALCRFPLHHTLNERFPRSLLAADRRLRHRKHYGSDRHQTRAHWSTCLARGQWIREEINLLK